MRDRVIERDLAFQIRLPVARKHLKVAFPSALVKPLANRIPHETSGIMDLELAHDSAPVELGGLKIAQGDLLHGDCHGVQTIPLSIAEDLPKAVKCVIEREAELIRFCESPDFSLEKLITILNREIPACQPPEWR